MPTYKRSHLLARRVEETENDETSARFLHRVALANFCHVYSEVQREQDQFIKKIDARDPSIAMQRQHSSNKRTVVKSLFCKNPRTIFYEYSIFI